MHPFQLLKLLSILRHNPLPGDPTLYVIFFAQPIEQLSAANAEFGLQ
jgi:hypothetical protein